MAFFWQNPSGAWLDRADWPKNTVYVWFKPEYFTHAPPDLYRVRFSRAAGPFFVYVWTNARDEAVSRAIEWIGDHDAAFTEYQWPVMSRTTARRIARDSSGGKVMPFGTPADEYVVAWAPEKVSKTSGEYKHVADDTNDLMESDYERAHGI